MNDKTHKEERILDEGPNLFLYEDYRVYLKDVYDHLKSIRSDFSFRIFSKMAGFSSPNYLKMVIDNQRNLTNQSIAKFAKALGLTSPESEFFEALVHFTQAKNKKAKTFQFDRMKKCRGYVEVKGIEKDQFDFFSHWYHMAVRELVSLSDFEDSPEWIAKRIRPEITETKAKKAIDLLIKLGFLERSEKGDLIQKDVTMATSPEMKSLAVRNLHRQMLARASHMLDEVSLEERDVSALTLGVNKKHIDLVKKRILEFRRSLLLEVGQSKDELEEVYQLTVQFFPLTQKIKKKGKGKK